MKHKQLDAAGSDHYISVIAGRLRAVAGYSRDLHEDDRQLLRDLATVVATLPNGSLQPMRELWMTRWRRRWRARNAGADLKGQDATLEPW